MEKLKAGKKGITNQACKSEFFADRMNHRFQRELILGKFLGVSGDKALLHAGVIDAQELVLGSGHVDKIGLAFRPLLVQELVHRLIGGRLFQVGANNLIQRLAKVRRAAFGGWIALGNVLAGLIHRWINAGEAHNGTAAGETAHIANLRHQLRGSPLAYAVHGPDSVILRKLAGQAIHLSTQDSQRGLGRGQLPGGGGDQQLGIAVPGQGCDMAHAVHIQFRRFPQAETIPLALAPLAVALGEGGLAGQVDALTVPKGHNKINPLLAAISTIRASIYRRCSHAGQDGGLGL